MHCTLLGRIITILSEVILDLQEDEIDLLPFAKVGSFANLAGSYSLSNYLILQYRYRYSYKYMDNISCYFLIKYNYLETSFVTY